MLLFDAQQDKSTAEDVLRRVAAQSGKFMQGCTTFKQLAMAISADDRPLAARRLERLLDAGLSPLAVLGDLMNPWHFQKWSDLDKDLAAPAALGITGLSLVYALNPCGRLPSWDTAKRHVAMEFMLLANRRQRLALFWRVSSVCLVDKTGIC